MTTSNLYKQTGGASSHDSAGDGRAFLTVLRRRQLAVPPHGVSTDAANHPVMGHVNGRDRPDSLEFPPSAAPEVIRSQLLPGAAARNKALAPDSDPPRVVGALERRNAQKPRRDAPLSDSRLALDNFLRFHKVVAEKSRTLHFLEPSQLDYISSDGNYLTLHCRGESYLNRCPLKSMTLALAQFGFLRIGHRLAINLNRVKTARRLDGGEWQFLMEGGMTLHSSTGYRKSIAQVLRVNIGIEPGRR